MTFDVTSGQSKWFLILVCAFFLGAPLSYAIVTESYFLAAGLVFFEVYVALCFVKVDAAIVCYLLIATSGINIPELEQLQYKGLILQNVLLGVLLLAAAAQVVENKRIVVLSPMNRPLFVVFGIYVFYCFWSTGPQYPDLWESVRSAKNVLVFPVLYWIVLNSASVESSRRPRYYLIGFMLITTIGTIHALWKYRQVLGDFTITYWNDQRINRHEALGETFYMTCVLAVLVLMYYVVQTKGNWPRRAMAITGIGVFAVTNMAFLYRAGTAALIVAMIVMAILLKQSRVIPWLLPLAAVILVALWFAPQILTRAESTYGIQRGGTIGFDPSFTNRKDYLWPTALSLIKTNFLWGIGYQNFERTIGMNVHNQFLSWLVELGITGFVAGIWFYIRICLFFWQRFVAEQDDWARAMALSSLSLMLSTVVWFLTHDFFLYGWLYHPLAFAGVLGAKAFDEQGTYGRVAAYGSR